MVSSHGWSVNTCKLHACTLTCQLRYVTNESNSFLRHESFMMSGYSVLLCYRSPKLVLNFIEPKVLITTQNRIPAFLWRPLENVDFWSHLFKFFLQVSVARTSSPSITRQIELLLVKMIFLFFLWKSQRQRGMELAYLHISSWQTALTLSVK